MHEWAEESQIKRPLETKSFTETEHTEYKFEIKTG